MCSVVGYIGTHASKEVVLAGLSRLEYRSYDTAGFACYDPITKKLYCIKSAGPLSRLYKKLKDSEIDGPVSIGYIQRVSNDVACDLNTQHYVGCEGQIALVHSGIIENSSDLKKQLEDHEFSSTSDSESLVHLLEVLIDEHKDLKLAVLEFIKKINGTYSIVFITKDFPECLTIIRKKSPLCIGIGDAELYVSSDKLSFESKTDKLVYLSEESFAILQKDKIKIYDFSGKQLDFNVHKTNAFLKVDTISLDSYGIKEVNDNKASIIYSIDHYQKLGNRLTDYLGISLKELDNLQSINLLGCGTAWHSTLIAKYFFENIVSVKTNAYLSSEFNCARFFDKENTLYIAVSHSGENYETLQAIEKLNNYSQQTIALVGVASSLLVRKANGFMIMQTNGENEKPSLKAFITQLISLFWLANKFALLRQNITQKQFDIACENVMVASQAIEALIENYKWAIDINLAFKYSSYKERIIVARGMNYALALEISLKSREIANIPMQVYHASELKNAILSFAEKNKAIFVLSDLNKDVYQKLVFNVQEARARGAYIISICFENQYELISISDEVFIVPHIDPMLTPVVIAGFMQYLIHSMSKSLNNRLTYDNMFHPVVS